MDPRYLTISERQQFVTTACATLGVLLIVGCAAMIPVTLYLFGKAMNHADSSYFSYEGGCLGTEPYSREMIEERGALSLPNSAQNISAHSEAFQDCTVYISFDMSPDDLHAFLASTNVPALELTRGDHQEITRFQKRTEVDWEFIDSQTYLYGESFDGSQEWQWIVVDTSNAAIYAVYVITLLM